MPNFFNRFSTSNKKSNSATQVAKEITLLAVVWLLLIVGFLLAGYGNSPKFNRYHLEWLSYTDGVTRPTLLKDTCGADVATTLYENRNTANYQTLQACDNPNAQQAVSQAATKARSQLNTIQTALAATWQSQGKAQRETKLVENETDIQLGADSLTSRQDWLNLNTNGQLDSINQLQSLKTANLNTQDLSLSLLAVADGNRRFPYSRLFANQPQVAKLLNQAASDVAGVYEANANHAKAEQARNLLPMIGTPQHFGMLTQVFIWSWVTLFLLILSRYRNPVLYLPLAITAWGVVMTVVSHTVIVPMMVGVAIFCLGVLLTILSVFSPGQHLASRFRDNREVFGSVWIYPLFVGFITFGLLILFDLSGRSYLSLRYIFLNHFKDIFWAFVLVSFARPISGIVAWGLKNIIANSMLHVYWDELKANKNKAFAWLGGLALAFLGLAVTIHSDSAKVAELAKIWLMVFLGVFLAINQRGLINHLFFRSKKMTALLLFAVALPFLALGIANEKGTMLVFLFMFTFLVGVALSNKIFQMGGRGYIIGVLSSTAILLLLMMGLVNLSGFDARTAERVNAWVNPFIATNDQMAILHWFRDSVPMLGYGLGDIPWCGYHLSGCQGVPLQMQSDYTITSVMAVVGIPLAIALMAVYFGWLVLIARQQMAYASEQVKSRLLSGGYFLLAWVILLWIVITVFQALVTISGNLGVLPLTGVTLPFLSYGTSNLWLNSILLSLALFQPKLTFNKSQ